ncbi:MAG: hypothetical protein A2010_01110 [Nitrospirae bacterium GWD2_57_9]|nr:MAG: hypothetical protein A2010_01110 [Nitrospirae bacterium GWD2_57_9]
MQRIPFFFILFAFFVCTSSGLAADESSTSKKELQRLNREMREKKRELKRVDKKERSILSDLDRIDREVQAGRAELAERRKQLRETELEFGEIEKNHAHISRELSGVKQVYARRLRGLYKMKRNGYATTLLSFDEGGDSLRRIKYLSLIAQRDQAVMLKYRTTLDTLALRQAEIADKKAQLLDRRSTIETKKAELEARKRNKAVLLASVREEKVLYEQTLRELEESSANLWGMIRKAERERKPENAARPKTAHANPGKNGYPWPLNGEVLTRFGMQRHPQFKTMVFRRGIEIAAGDGEPVKAVSDGQVAFADWYKGYGKLMIIEHGPGFYTLYGNLSRLDLKKGDRVAGGQVIGLAGDTGSLKGSKLYFEMRRNGEALDPLPWLAKH